MDKPRNLLISDVTLNWARLDTPTNPFGTEIYELQIATSDAAVAAQWTADFLNVKERDGIFVVSLKRNAKKRDGSDNGKVRVVGADKMPLSATIGNWYLKVMSSYGSILTPLPGGRSGISGSLTAVQVTELVEYNSGSVDFDVVADAPAQDTPAADMF